MPHALKWRPLQLDPALHGRSLPLMPRVVRQMLRHIVAVQYEPVEHQRKVHVSDAPVVEQSHAEQSLPAALCASAESASRRAP